MITDEMILAEVRNRGITIGNAQQNVIEFAKHMYQQGLLDAAQSCEDDYADRLMHIHHAERIRDMAKEVGNDE